MGYKSRIRFIPNVLKWDATYGRIGSKKYIRKRKIRSLLNDFN
jgi:hypothetical protein